MWGFPKIGGTNIHPHITFYNPYDEDSQIRPPTFGKPHAISEAAAGHMQWLACLEGQGDLVSRLIRRIAGVLYGL